MNIYKEKPIQKDFDVSVAEKKTLLLVDDEKAILEFCKEFLEQQRYTVLIADAPDVAIQVARNYSGRINMLITDIVMPVMNGLELAETLSCIRPDIKCVFISGYPPEAIFGSKMCEKMNFIQKPFKLKDFAEKIQYVLNQ